MCTVWSIVVPNYIWTSVYKVCAKKNWLIVIHLMLSYNHINWSQRVRQIRILLKERHRTLLSRSIFSCPTFVVTFKSRKFLQKSRAKRMSWRVNTGSIFIQRPLRFIVLCLSRAMSADNLSCSTWIFKNLLLGCFVALLQFSQLFCRCRMLKFENDPFRTTRLFLMRILWEFKDFTSWIFTRKKNIYICLKNYRK